MKSSKKGTTVTIDITDFKKLVNRIKKQKRYIKKLEKAMKYYEN